MNPILRAAALFAALLATTSCATPIPPPAIVSTATSTSATPPPAQAAAPSIPRPDRTQPGPWDSDVLIIRIGTDGRQERLGLFERAGVPTAARLLDGRLIAAYQAFPADDDRNFDRVAKRFSSDGGRIWSGPEPIVVDGMEAGLDRPFDPTLVPLPDGRIRIYFTSNRNADSRRSTPAIYSAISSDAIHYTFEPGI